ncbi:anthrax toxin lethal factor-related metalloendopeptidase [Metabacillus arenae]|uniref:Toxin n=1 Tax=Metabacillus arenae TaxID=2771434 RepID=A0A926S234_9BACI|nr:toxin [Metabacillus arenae]MBD1381604.1 toxin [Metabacillus arenae]
MKKAIIISFIFTSLLVSVYQLVKASPTSISLGNYQFQKEKLKVTNPAIKQLVFLPEVKFSEKDAIEMIRHLDQVDANILQLAVKQNIKVILFTGLLTDQNQFQDLKGVIPRGYPESGPSWDAVPGIAEGNKVFAKIGHSEYGSGHGSIALELHEFGHAIDRYLFKGVRKDPVFLNIWKKEAAILFEGKNYYVRFPEEYFAEAFAMYYFNKESRTKLEVTAPLTYNYIIQLEQHAAQTNKYEIPLS